MGQVGISSCTSIERSQHQDVTASRRRQLRKTIKPALVEPTEARKVLVGNGQPHNTANLNLRDSIAGAASNTAGLAGIWRAT